MEAYSTKWNVFALDIKNEPNGIATWVRTHFCHNSRDDNSQ
jgi:hypothetical protein